MTHFKVCSWTEKALIQSHEFHPKYIKTAKQSKYYAIHFDIVEVDSALRLRVLIKGNRMLISHKHDKNLIFYRAENPKELIFC